MYFSKLDQPNQVFCLWGLLIFLVSFQIAQFIDASNYRTIRNEVKWNRNIQFIMDSDQNQPQTSNSNVRAETLTFSIKKVSVLKCVKIHLKILGCLPIDQRNWPLRLQKIPFNNIHVGFIFSILTLNLLSTCWFYICKVETFIDFFESVFWVSRAVLSLALYAMFIWYNAELIKFFNDIDDIVDKSEFILI